MTKGQQKSWCKARKENLEYIIDIDKEARLTKNKHKVVAYMIEKMFSQQLKDIPKSTLTDIVFNIVQGDRSWRKLTEDWDKKEKKRLSQKWQIDNGYEVGHYQDIKKLKTL